MKQEFKTYLTKIGITEELYSKIENAIDVYEKYLGFQLDDIIISEYLMEDGSRNYENLWFLNESFCFEAKLFLTQENYDVDKFKNAISYITIQKIDFDINSINFSDKSRLLLTFRFGRDRIGIIKASKENCVALSLIIKKYIITNFK